MREIKFRAWDEKEKCWIGGFSIHSSGMFADWAGVKEVNGQHIADANWEWPEKLPNIRIMQYTGLKDRNGKEIYEGDFWEYHGANYVVTWHEDDAKFFFKHTSKFATDDDHIDLGWSTHGKVIGNIDENPELLETQGNK